MYWYFILIFCGAILLESKTWPISSIDKLVNLDRSKMKKCVRYFGYGTGRILGGSWSTNTPDWLKHNRIVLPTNTKVVAHSGRQVADWFLHPNTIFRSYSFSPGYVGEYKCTLVGLGLLVCLWYRRLRCTVFTRLSSKWPRTAPTWAPAPTWQG